MKKASAIFVCVMLLASLHFSYAGESLDKIGVDENTKNAGEKGEFCGISTEDNCVLDSDCYNAGCGICKNRTSEIIPKCTAEKCQMPEKFSKKCSCKEGKCEWGFKFVKSKNMTKEEFKEFIKERNQERKMFKFEEKTGQECVEGCACAGVTMKCKLGDGSREMTVYAKSGNIIFQVKNVNASTNVTLYHHNKTIYAEFPNGTLKELKIMPDEVQERIREKIKSGIEGRNITLNENGFYEVQMQKKSRLFYLFPVREKVNAEVNAENGEVVKVRNSWWGFLAKDD